MAPIGIRRPLGPKFLPLERANAIDVCKLSSYHLTCVTKSTNGGWRLESKLCSKPWAAVPPEGVRSSDVQKLISLRLKKTPAEVMEFGTNASGTSKKTTVSSDTPI